MSVKSFSHDFFLALRPLLAKVNGGVILDFGLKNESVGNDIDESFVHLLRETPRATSLRINFGYTIESGPIVFSMDALTDRFTNIRKLEVNAARCPQMPVIFFKMLPLLPNLATLAADLPVTRNANFLPSFIDLVD